ncbi:MAG: TGS domain-containing protein, partial [Anaerolineales bacterium]|nr:TGS domain-containing protein [Anaerolineales bacterium]
EKINWLRQLQEWRAEVTSARDFVDALKTDVFNDQVYVFTPKGQIIEMASGATPIDFAYHIHTEVGNRCRGAKVNGKLVALETPLKTGDRVEILTAKKGGPSRDWLNPTLGLVHTARAREKIRQYFKKQEREVARIEGRALLEKELHRLGFGNKNLDEIAKQFNFKNVDELAEAIGYADISLQAIGVKLLDIEQAKTSPPPPPALPAETKPRPKPQNEVGLEIGGVGGLLTRVAHCCKPVPGDEIVGYISRGRGIAIHRRDCKNVIDHEGTDGRWIALSWKGMKQEQVYPVLIEVRAFDRAGLLHDLSGVVAEENVNMTSLSSKSRRDNTALVTATLEIGNANQLTRILNKIERLPNVLEARRVSG